MTSALGLHPPDRGDRGLVNDTEVFKGLLDENDTAKDVYADHGYAKHARETELYVQRAFGEHPFALLAQMGASTCGRPA